MLPTIDESNNLLLLDCFTTKFVRYPKKHEVILAENPLKPGHTIVKRVVGLEGEEIEFTK